MPELQYRLAPILPGVLPAGSALRHEWAPSWLIRPGRPECGAAWPRITNTYRLLTGAELPDTMPPRERRRLDVVITYPDGRQQILEVNETQHFTAARATTGPLHG